jgi:hypothetical protein
VPVFLDLREGQALRFDAPAAAASGAGLARFQSVFNIGRIEGFPRGGLAGMFLADQVTSPAAAGTTFSQGMQMRTVLRPGLQQPFYIGTGKTPDGQDRVIVVPKGATRLFIGTLNFAPPAGSEVIQVAVDQLSTAPKEQRNPARVFDQTPIALAGTAPGTAYEATHSSPVNSPVEVDIAISETSALQFSVVGALRPVDASAATLFNHDLRLPDGDEADDATGRFFTGSASVGSSGALVGLFRGEGPATANAVPAYAANNNDIFILSRG